MMSLKHTSLTWRLWGNALGYCLSPLRGWVEHAYQLSLAALSFALGDEEGAGGEHYGRKWIRVNPWRTGGR
jgi:hypothetical protein